MAQSSHTRTVIDVTPEQVRVVMPVPRVGCVTAFLGVWMIGWVVGEYSAIRALFTSAYHLNLSALFLVFWLLGWTAGGVVFGALFLLLLDGREIVTVGDGIIRRRVEAFGVGLSWRYSLEQSSNWRPTGAEGDDGVNSFVSFDHNGPKGMKMIRFGTGLTESRVEEITTEVLSRFPLLRPRS